MRGQHKGGLLHSVPGPSTGSPLRLTPRLAEAHRDSDIPFPGQCEYKSLAVIIKCTHTYPPHMHTHPPHTLVMHTRCVRITVGANLCAHAPYTTHTVHHAHIPRTHTTHTYHTHIPHMHVHKLTQTNSMVSATVLAEGRLIEQYIQGAEHPVENVLRELSSPTRQHPTPADQEVAGHIEASLQSKPLSIHEATQKFGKACCKTFNKIS